jgi:D-xylose transport system permease protein
MTAADTTADATESTVAPAQPNETQGKSSPEKPSPGASPPVAIRDFSMIMALAALWVTFALSHPAFLSPRNLSLLATELSITAVVALGMLIVLLPAQIDLSAGSGVGLTGAVAAVLVTRANLPSGLALLLTLILGVAIWTAMGFAIIRQQMPSFIVTLGGLLVFRGFHYLTLSGQTVPISPGGAPNFYSALTTWYLPPWAGYLVGALFMGGYCMATLKARARRMRHKLTVDDSELTFLKLFVAGQITALFIVITNAYQGVPLAALILGATLLFVNVLTQHTAFGRYLYAVGGNFEAARLSGVPVERVVIGAFALMGAIVALGGFLQTAYAGASTPTVGELMELDAIAACVIGGTSLRGGRGTVMGVLFGALIMATLLSGMTLLAASPETKLIVRGSVLALAVWLDVRLAR